MSKGWGKWQVQAIPPGFGSNELTRKSIKVLERSSIPETVIIEMVSTTTHKDDSVDFHHDAIVSGKVDYPTLADNSAGSIVEPEPTKASLLCSSMSELVQKKISILSLHHSNLLWKISLGNEHPALQFRLVDDAQSFCDACYRDLKDGKCIYEGCHRYGAWPVFRKEAYVLFK